MKKVTKTKTETKTITKDVVVYVADDGTEFNNEFECLAYERENIFYFLRKKHENDFPDVIGWPPYVMDYLSDDYSFLWMRVTDEEDVKVINGLIEGNEYQYPIPFKIGDIMCIEFDDAGYLWCDKLENTVNSMSRFLKSFGYGVVKLEG